MVPPAGLPGNDAGPARRRYTLAGNGAGGCRRARGQDL